MSASANAYNLIKQFEKFIPNPYDKDGGGNCTIGYGHLIRPSLCTSADYAKYPNGISLSEA